MVHVLGLVFENSFSIRTPTSRLLCKSRYRLSIFSSYSSRLTAQHEGISTKAYFAAKTFSSQPLTIIRLFFGPN